MKRDNSFLIERLIAHRGIHNDKVIENTLLAFKKAIDKGYDIELDVRLSLDKRVVVFHDNDLKRIYGRDLRVRDLSYRELKKLGICSLDEVIKLVNGRVNLLIELKGRRKDFSLEKEVVRILDNYNGKFAIQSFDIRSILWFLIHRRNYIRGVLISFKNSKYNRYIYKFISLFGFVDFISCNFRLYNDKIVMSKKGKIPVIGWTIDNGDDYNYYKDYFDNLICDNLEVYDEE